MILYRVTYSIDKGETGADWFSAHAKAKQRYHELLRGCKDESDLFILDLDRVEVVDLPPKQLLLNALNGQDCIKSVERLASAVD